MRDQYGEGKEIERWQKASLNEGIKNELLVVQLLRLFGTP